jgi:hypothetical protein
MTHDQEGTAIAGHFEVAVAFAPVEEVRVVSPVGNLVSAEAEGIPGTKEAAGNLHLWRQRPEGQQRPTLVEKGEAVTRRATEALAGQIGATARLIAEAIGRQEAAALPAEPSAFGLDSVEVQYGITLSAGLQTVFTAQAESSVQVTITLTRNRDQKS